MSSAPDKIDTTVHPPTIGQVPRALWILVGAMAVIELILSAADAGLLGSTEWRGIAIALGAFQIGLLTGEVTPIYSLQPYLMFLTHPFLHFGFMSMAISGVIILSIGKLISDQAGAGAAILLFIVCSIGSGIGLTFLPASFAFNIGALGVAFGFMGLWQYWEGYIRLLDGEPLKPIFLNILGLLILNLVMLLWYGSGFLWQSNLGGFVAGLAMGPVMTHYARKNRAQ